MMELKYHQATLDLLRENRIEFRAVMQESDQRLSHYKNPDHRRSLIATIRRKMLRLECFNRALDNPCVSAENIQQLDVLERHYSVILPAAVREWYSLNFVPYVMSLHASLNAISRVFHRPIYKMSPVFDEESDDPLWYQLWAFTSFYPLYGDGPYYVAFKADDGDDPSVYTETDQIRLLAPRFSEFMTLFFEDWIAERTYPYHFLLRDFADSFGISPSGSMFPAPPLLVTDLRQRYQERAGNLETRFFDDTTWIQCEVHKDRLSSAIFRTRTADQLRHLIAEFWGDKSPVLYAHMDIHDISHAILEPLRQVQILKALREFGDWMTASMFISYLNCHSEHIWGALKSLALQGVIQAQRRKTGDAPREWWYRARKA